MKRFNEVFTNKCSVIGMIHVDALPGTPKYKGNFEDIIEKAKHEASVYKRYNLDAVLIENMHDVPYLQSESIGPETIACMTKICSEVKQILHKTPCGVQILAAGNKQALAVAKACNLQFIRVEGFIFGHVADEGFINACAGDLLRYRKQIDAENVLIFTDIKKKHSSHSITSDISLLETGKAAEFFLSDGIIITGISTGAPANIEDLSALEGKLKIPIIVGSGITAGNIQKYYKHANAVIVGSQFKENGYWANELSEDRISELMDDIRGLQV